MFFPFSCEIPSCHVTTDKIASKISLAFLWSLIYDHFTHKFCYNSMFILVFTFFIKSSVLFFHVILILSISRVILLIDWFAIIAYFATKFFEFTSCFLSPFVQLFFTLSLPLSRTTITIYLKRMSFTKKFLPRVIFLSTNTPFTFAHSY